MGQTGIMINFLKLKKNLKSYLWDIESIIHEIAVRATPIREGRKLKNVDKRLIVSLTSYEPRFKKLNLTIKCLLSQEIKPDNLILWVSHNDLAKLPIEISKLCEKFNHFEIKTYEDIKSYKKLIPALEHFPGSYIVTADDDVYYPRDWLSSLVDHLPCEKKVIAHRAHKPKFVNNRIAPYKEWEHCITETKQNLVMPTGIGGVLYTPGCFNNQVFDKEKFMTIAPTADDLWFFWMAYINHTEIITSGRNFNIVNWLGTNDGGLAEQNVKLDENDRTIKRLESEFGNLNN